MRAIYFDNVPVAFLGERAEQVMADAIRLHGLDARRFAIAEYPGTLPLVGDALVESLAKLAESGLERVMAHSKRTDVRYQLWCETCQYPWVSASTVERCPACGGVAKVRAEFEQVDVRRD